MFDGYYYYYYFSVPEISIKTNPIEPVLSGK